jgi:hypothetical protein
MNLKGDHTNKNQPTLTFETGDLGSRPEISPLATEKNHRHEIRITRKKGKEKKKVRRPLSNKLNVEG